MIETPHTIDDPAYFLIWRLDDIVPLAVAVVIGILISQLLLSLLVGFFIVRHYRKQREHRPEGYALHWLYWMGFLPLRGRSTPNPFSRRWIA